MGNYIDSFLANVAWGGGWPRDNGSICSFGISAKTKRAGFAKRGACKRGLRKLGHRTYQVHSNYITETWSNHDCHWQQCIFSQHIKKESAQPKCASCMNHIWAIALFGEARFTPARSADYQKRGRAGRGRDKKIVTTSCDKRHDNLRHVTTICDILWQFPSLCSIDIKRHKSPSNSSWNVTTICDNLWHFLSRPLPPVPFWISPVIFPWFIVIFGHVWPTDDK